MAEEDKIIITCPHCEQHILIFKNEINCAIFRHAVFKDSFMQIAPHLPRDQCDQLIQQDKVFGCAKPFRIQKENETYVAVICDYI